MLTNHRIRRTTIALALAGALVAPAASVADDHWSWTSSRQDARDAALTQERYYSSYDSDANASGRQDLRSPDTRDAALGRGTWSAPDVTVVKLREPVPVAESGMDWGDAGLGAGTVFGVILVGLAAAMAIVHRRRRGPRTATAA
jgi:hypothetical protein